MPPLRVLVLDDEQGILRLCTRLLEGAGFQVKVSDNPHRALTLLETLKWDLLVVDIRMPEMSGFDVVARVRALQPDMAILVMTGFGTVETAIQALRQGVDGLLLKPFEGREFLDAVSLALESNRSKQEALRSRMLRPLFDVSETLFRETDPGALGQQILSILLTHFGSEQAALYEQKGEHLFLLAARGAVPVDASDGLLAYALGQDAPLRLEAEEPAPTAVRAALEAHGMGAVLLTPVHRPDTTFWLLAARSPGETPFRDSDLEMFVIFARQAAVAMENARLYDALRASLRQLESSQQALIQAEKMAAAGRLTASLAHEINNPLQGVQNCLHLAMQESLPAERRQSYFDMALRELERLRDTVRQMLNFYRRPPQEAEAVDVHAVLLQARQLLESQFQERGIRWAWHLQAETPRVRGVSNQLQQVFVNLMLNAYDAMPAGGRLEVKTCNHQGGVRISFTDDGPGVPAEVQGRVFEPFMSTKETGTGLGLTVSYNIIDAHGGALWLDTDWSAGARFVIDLPREDEKESIDEPCEDPHCG